MSNSSMNPIESLVRKAGFTGKTAEYVIVAIFAVCFYIAVGLVLEGVYA